MNSIDLNSGSIDTRVIDEMSQLGYIRKIKGNIAEIFKDGKIVASYPEWGDIIISFDEKLDSVHDSTIRKILEGIFHIIKLTNNIYPTSQDELYSIEQYLVNKPLTFLYSLAWLYSISSDLQKDDIISNIIGREKLAIEYF